MRSTIIAGYARTPFGKFLGALQDIPAVELGALVIKETLKRAKLKGDIIDNVILGMVIQAGAGQIPSRQATIRAGLPAAVPSETINKVCASGLRAVNLGDALIRVGEANLILAGGMENMSAVPYFMPGGRLGYRMGDAQLIDGMVHDGLWCPFHQVHMGVHGSAVPAENGITREQMDYYALRSHHLALQAIRKGLFQEETVTVKIPQRKGNPINFDTDELPREDTTYERLAKLPPAFEKDGLITAGNAPPISDGAATLLLASKTKAKELRLQPLAEIIAQAAVSLEPRYIATVPYEAAQLVLHKSGLKISDMKLIEVNEAFAAVALTCIKLGRWDENIVNVNGGAVAIGHPIGASGARILITLIAELRRRGGGYGLATICSGAAQGEAIIIKV
jgi:acetyl-CoA C-acetyltransferase